MLPEDPVMLVSYINTKLRDEYSTLDQLCLSEGVSKEDIEDKLSKIDFHYDISTNSFR